MEPNEKAYTIWKSFQAGDKEAFAYIYNLHLDNLFHYGTKFTSDGEQVKDAIHEVFLDLYLKRAKNTTNPENLKFYLMLALKRNLIKKLVKGRKNVDELYPRELMFEPEYNIESQIIGKEQEEETFRRIRGVICQLPSKQKEAVYLRYNQALEYEEVAHILDISVESARKQVYRAVKTIRDLLGKEFWVFWVLYLHKK